jgi:D-glycero-D-manno-heptose 1,7-bisphosphate phosphatase
LRKAIFLDRDGVLNQTVFRNGKPRAPYTLEEFSLYPGVTEAARLFKEMDYLLVVVTNQPDVARGWVSREAVDMVNDRIKELIFLDDIKICFHTDADQCQCRKPRPGMLLEAKSQWNIDVTKSFMIGDRHSDIEAGIQAGCRTILIGEGDHSSIVKPDFQKSSLLEAARLIASMI